MAWVSASKLQTTHELNLFVGNRLIKTIQLLPAESKALRMTFVAEEDMPDSFITLEYHLLGEKVNQPSLSLQMFGWKEL